MCDKGEPSFQGDSLRDFAGLKRGRDYVEVRDWWHQERDIQITFSFITRYKTFIFTAVYGGLLAHICHLRSFKIKVANSSPTEPIGLKFWL